MRVKPITYKEWYSHDQFKEIKNLFENDSNGDYRVASLGLHPAIAAYNNIPTIDGYHNFYSLRYKKEFRKILNSVIENPKFFNKKYFDKWGSRLYLFIDETPYFFNSINSEGIDFIYDVETMKKLGCKYIISAYKIKNNTNSNKLKFLKIINDQNSFYDLWIYKIL